MIYWELQSHCLNPSSLKHPALIVIHDKTPQVQISEHLVLEQANRPHILNSPTLVFLLTSQRA
jgi:hypothetical protein